MSTNHNLFEEKAEPKQYRTEVLPLTSLPPYRWAKPALTGKGTWYGYILVTLDTDLPIRSDNTGQSCQVEHDTGHAYVHIRYHGPEVSRAKLDELIPNVQSIARVVIREKLGSNPREGRSAVTKIRGQPSNDSKFMPHFTLCLRKINTRTLHI